MRDKKLVVVLAILMFAVLLVANAHATDRPNVRMFVWNPLPAPGTNTYPFKPNPQTTLVQIWIDAPNAWTNTPLGIVSYNVKLHFDPAIVEATAASQFPDADGDGFANGFLGWFLSDYHPEWTQGLLWAPPLIDNVAGTAEVGEAIAGFTTLGVGAGGGMMDPSTFEVVDPAPMVRITIRTKAGVTSGGSLLEIVTAIYTTIDSVQHPVEVVENGIYGAPVVPEFPFGIGILMMIVPAFAVMYLWRRKKVTKP